jgi:hypothetical protein
MGPAPLASLPRFILMLGHAPAHPFGRTGIVARAKKRSWDHALSLGRASNNESRPAGPLSRDATRGRAREGVRDSPEGFGWRGVPFPLPVRFAHRPPPLARERCAWSGQTGGTGPPPQLTRERCAWSGQTGDTGPTSPARTGEVAPGTSCPRQSGKVFSLHPHYRL